MSDTLKNPLFEKVENALYESERLIAWDGCHKIYVATSAPQAEWFRDCYPEVVQNDDVDALLATLAAWWDASCDLRFINAVQHCESNPNAGFTTLIGQGEQEHATQVVVPADVHALMGEDGRQFVRIAGVENLLGHQQPRPQHADHGHHRKRALNDEGRNLDPLECHRSRVS